MVAKVRTLQVPPDQVQRGVEYLRSAMLPMARGIDGFRGMIGLVDRETGKAVTVTLWETDEALRRSEEGGDELRQRGGAPPSDWTVERYEVVVADLPGAEGQR